MLAAAGGSGTNTFNFKELLSPERIEKFGPKIVAALGVLIVGLILARYIGKAMMRGLSKRDMEPPMRMLLVRFVKLIVLFFTLMIAVQNLGVDILALVGVLGVAGVGVGLAMQGVLSNLVAGLTIIFVKSFRIGEYIEINNVQGQVETIELFTTTLIHPDRSRVLVPNRKIVGEIIHNYGKIRQADLSVGVGYDTDLNQAMEIIRDIYNQNPRVLKDPAPVVGTSTLADSSIVLAIKPWASVADYGAMQGEVTKAVVERFREAGIQIPFPQREIRILPGSESRHAVA
jgi:small conductance mechanosensitive channel